MGYMDGLSPLKDGAEKKVKPFSGIGGRGGHSNGRVGQKTRTMAKRIRRRTMAKRSRRINRHKHENNAVRYWRFLKEYGTAGIRT